MMIEEEADVQPSGTKSVPMTPRTYIGDKITLDFMFSIGYG